MWRFDDVALLVVVIEEGSFAKAAERLDIPTSTVSRRIAALEAALGVALIERTSRRLKATSSGQRLVEQCARPIKEVRENIGLLDAESRTSQGRLRVTAPVFLGTEMLNQCFCEFLLEYPGVELDIVLSNRYEELIDNQIDLAIRIGPLKDSQYIAQYLFTSRFVLCASPAYLKQHTTPQTPKDLNSHSVMTMPHQQKSITFLDTDGEELKVAVNARMYSNELGIGRSAALNGVCISCLPQHGISEYLKQGRLVQVLGQYEILHHRDIYAVYPSKKHLPQRTRHLIEHLKHYAAKLD